MEVARQVSSVSRRRKRRGQGTLQEQQVNERWITNVKVKMGGMYLEGTEYTWNPVCPNLCRWAN